MSFKSFLLEFKKEHKGYVFDIDDTLLKTDSKIFVNKDGKKIKSLTPEQFNTYKLSKGEEFDFSDFISNDTLVATGKKTDYWQVAQNVNNAIKNGTSKSTIYILTARPAVAKKGLHAFLVKNGLSELKLDNVFNIGGRSPSSTIAQLKKMVLKQVKKKHKEVTFFDDDPKNIALANELKKVKSRLVKI